MRPSAARRRIALSVLAASLVWALAPLAAAAQRISVTVNRTEVTIEDQILLVIRVEGASGADPELPTLDGFRVTPAGQETQMSFVNGRSTSSVSYRFLLTPQRTGTFEVGVATVVVDGETHASKPFQIRVLEASERPQEERDLFVTARVSTTTPWVGQQVIHTWRFYRRVQVTDARLEPPAFDGFLVEELGELREYQATVGGRQYLVSELRRALFPQEAGKLAITPSQLTVEAVLQSQGRGSRSLFDDFFSQRSTERRVLRGPTLELEVRPLPPAPPGFSGLVGEFDIGAELSRRDLKVGESATFKVTVAGRGNAMLIGEPALPPLSEFKVYDDRPSSSLDRSGNELSGSKVFSKALVPLAAGELVIPALALTYFDPESEDYRTARTSPISLRVAPADGEEDLGLTESLAPTAGKVSVRIVADDILPLYKELDAAAPPPALGRTWALTGGLLLPPVLYLAVALGLRRRQRFALDANLRRRRRALRTALKKLSKLAAADERSVADLASLCLREFVGDKLGVEGSALTPAEVAGKLGERAVDEQLARAATELLRRLEAAQYGAARVAVADARAELEPLLRKLDKELDR